ncbi:DUF1515 family protein [Mesorhizobium sophorae]|uniref:DUF1515 family protein n=1 Tax=Mesorhizobium sophorae TaxID=1300294 RepID=UPI001FD9ABE9|nr:DUF1515 family protein [Mesorhizobium sophorae]
MSVAIGLFLKKWVLPILVFGITLPVWVFLAGAEVTRWKLMGMGALGVTGIAFASLGSVVTYYWTDIWRVLRGM